MKVKVQVIISSWFEIFSQFRGFNNCFIIVISFSKSNPVSNNGFSTFALLELHFTSTIMKLLELWTLSFSPKQMKKIWLMKHHRTLPSTSHVKGKILSLSWKVNVEISNFNLPSYQIHNLNVDISFGTTENTK